MIGGGGRDAGGDVGAAVGGGQPAQAANGDTWPRLAYVRPLSTLKAIPYQ